MAHLPEIPAFAYTPKMDTLGVIPDIPIFEGDRVLVSRNALTPGTRPLQLLQLPGSDFLVARFTLLLLFASTFWSNRKEKFNPSILRSLENLAHLEEYDWAGAILSRIIPYYLPDGPPALREVSMESVDRLSLPSEDITEVPVGLVNQMMELVLVNPYPKYQA
ncbi:hypothetical protein JCGZ_15001 [Jatropha curcas]|uniref:Aminotransferase-like plant mobile domain-containing protein n=1 Tax=Jatropha curcas TaxID=180498 RepID=A0A067K6L4_JATCU|nr:hypothetical protein JCGZ_15001 [Jatropha curcas]